MPGLPAVGVLLSVFSPVLCACHNKGMSMATKGSDENTRTSEASAPPFRSGFVAIVGRPNVGKSTLLNCLLGEKIAIVSPKPQTTRNRILGIKTTPQAQMILLDTPGIHRARSLLTRRMVDTARRSIEEVDLALWVLDARSGIQNEDRDIGELLAPWDGTALIVLNKIDRVPKPSLLPLIERCTALLPGTDIVPASARSGENMEVLIDEILAHLPVGPRYYPGEEVTDQTERFIASEIIREKVFLLTRQEVPYATVVTVDHFEEKKDGSLVVITATIHAERETQKPILIGKRGTLLKSIGEHAREELERLLGCRVYLDLAVRVAPSWTRSERTLAQFGL